MGHRVLFTGTSPENIFIVDKIHIEPFSYFKISLMEYKVRQSFLTHLQNFVLSLFVAEFNDAIQDGKHQPLVILGESIQNVVSLSRQILFF